jgi:hypothetical protein
MGCAPRRATNLHDEESAHAPPHRPVRRRRLATRAEFRAETDTYEVNVRDIRPDPKYANGGIVDFAAVPVPLVPKAGGRWNTFEIEGRGTKISVQPDGVTTATLDNGQFAEGPFAPQCGAGVQGATGGPTRWRKVQVRAL